MRSDIISVGGGKVPLKSRDEVYLWCVNVSGRFCMLVLPNSAHQTMDGMTTAYSEKHRVAVTIGCIGVNTESPLLLPAAIPLDMHSELSSMAAPVDKHVQPCSVGASVTRLLKPLGLSSQRKGRDE